VAVTAVFSSSVVVADVKNWQTEMTIRGTEFVNIGPGVYLGGYDLPYAEFSGGVDLTKAIFFSSNLDNARFDQAILTGANFKQAKLPNTNFSQANLTGTIFDQSTLTNAIFADAIVKGTSFWDTTSRGFTKEQLYSTASYKNKDLRGMALSDLRVRTVSLLTRAENFEILFFVRIGL
jgi:uncharacterized protein YjbI with pentapeptide repeats